MWGVYKGVYTTVYITVYFTVYKSLHATNNAASYIFHSCLLCCIHPAIFVTSQKRFRSNLSPHFSNTFPINVKIYQGSVVILNIFFLFCPCLAIPR